MKSLSYFLFLICISFGAGVSWGQSNYNPYVFDTFVGTAAGLSSPTEIAVDSGGNLFVADTNMHVIRKITPSGVVTTLAGSPGNPGSADGTGAKARFSSPIGVALDTAGNLFVGDSDNNTIRKVTPAGVVTTFAGLAGESGSANGKGSVARFNGPRETAVDASGNVFVADTFNDTIRKITPTGVVTTFAGLAGESGSANGIGSAARFFQPRGVTVDGAGKVYVADTVNSTIRVITPAGAVSTLAGLARTPGSADGKGSSARFNAPASLRADDFGNLFIADTVNDIVRKIDYFGNVTTLAGSPLVSGSADGTGMNARFASPQGVGLNLQGIVFISDTGNNTIRSGHSEIPTPTPTPTPAPSPSPTPNHPLNISTRAHVDVDPNALIGGFIITGNSPKKVIARALGPSLQQQGLTGVLADPVLELHAGDGSLISQDDNWQDNSAQADMIRDSGIPPTDPRESAIVATLNPGNYTTIVRGKDNTSGIGLVEVYDLDQAADSILANVSTRASVQTGESILIGGFILGGGTGNTNVAIRALGPSLADAGVSGVLADPTLDIRNAQGTRVVFNDNWADSADDGVAIQAADLEPEDAAEAAIVVNLAPGNYTALVAGKNNGTGVGLVEVYALP
jgi:hypothetical protein